MQPILQRMLFGDLAPYMVGAAVTVGVGALFYGVRYLLASRVNVVKDRAQRAGVGKPTGLMAEVEAEVEARKDPSQGVLQQFLSSFSKLGRPTGEEELGRLRSHLHHGGFRGELAMATYLVTKMLLGLAAGGIVLWITSLNNLPLRFTAFYTVLAMTIAFYLPNVWLHMRVENRQAEINHSLPDALDLVVTCVEAGLGLDSAVERVTNEIQLSSQLLSAELAQASLEMKAGMPRGEAFRRMANRTGVEELHNLAAIIIQTDVFGTSVAKSLRVQADAMRIRRTQRAEERAAKVAVKLTVPLVFCILPSLFAVLMGPAVVKIIKVLLPTLGGQR
jgi:tight adherence protein C